ncbi:MAG: alanine racemase [Methylobacillus sp.]|jgi:alanine racemase|nr:alanine racemase [Methylobacillus sp.]
MTRPIHAIIHADALCHNLAVARRHAPRSKMLAVIKANGYGHGMLRVARALQDADGFGVLSLAEAVALREAGFRQTVLVLEGLFDADELPLAARHGVSVVVHSEPQLRMLETARGLSPLDVFLKINTGMNRLGVAVKDFRKFYERLRACEAVGAITLMTHFATADEAPGIADQWAVFNQLTEGIAAPRTLANSAAILRHPETHADWARPGIMLYGASPFADEYAAQLDLQPAMTLRSEIIAVQTLQSGDAVGYGRRFVAEKTMRVGTVACGYADGYPRHAPTGTPIAVAGKMTRTLGRVSMDMLCADLSDIPEADIGSPVELWGGQVPVDAVAQASGTIGYELLCAVAARVPVCEHG